MKLNKREKYGIYLVAAVAVLFVIAEFVVPPIVETRTRQQRTLKQKEKMLDELNTLSMEYKDLRQQVDIANRQMAKRPKNFRLFSFLEQLSRKARVKRNVAYMKPSTAMDKNTKRRTSQVEMKLKGVTLEQLTNYIHLVESSENMVYIKRASVAKAGKRGDSIDATLLVETYES